MLTPRCPHTVLPRVAVSPCQTSRMSARSAKNRQPRRCHPRVADEARCVAPEVMTCLKGQRRERANPSLSSQPGLEQSTQAPLSVTRPKKRPRRRNPGAASSCLVTTRRAGIQSLTPALTASTGQEASSRMRCALDPRISLPTGVRRRRPITMKSALTSLATSIRSCEGSLPRTS